MKGFEATNREALARRIEAARGVRRCDVVFRDVRYLDVFSAEIVRGDVAVYEGFIVGVEAGREAAQVVSGKDLWLVPGFVDAHVHVESSMMLPDAFERAVLPRGTTTAVCDPHELANVVGVSGLEFFLAQAEELSLDLWVMLSACVPATHLETNGGGVIAAPALAQLATRPRALGLAEVMNVPGVLAGDAAVLDKLTAFSGRPIDGHCPLLSGAALSAYAAAGIGSCHESSRLGEAKEKLHRGLAVWIREGSVAKDLTALAPILNATTSPFVGFCTDDRNPHDIAHEGHLDHLVRGAIALGVPAAVAYRSAAWSVARHYGLDQGPGRIGAIAPGYRADLVLLDDLDSCRVRRVMKSGRWADELPAAPRIAVDLTHTMKAAVPEVSALVGPSGQVHVIGVTAGKILTGRQVLAHDAPGVARLTVLERHGHGRAPANGYVIGFGELDGAIASSVGHDSHNLIAVGKNPTDMRAALACLIASGGGFAVVRGGAVQAHVALPYAGLMSGATAAELTSGLAGLQAASRAIGCALPDPFLQLAFLSLPVIPTLKLTDHGLVDVDKFEVIDVRAA